MSTFIFIVLVLIALTVVLALLAPKEYEINRSISINKPLEEVFTYLKSLKEQDDWSPWAEKDPNREKSFTGIDGEVGCISAWKGNKGVGEGEQEITNIVENVSVETQLRFLKPFKSISDAYLRVKKEGEGTQVIWGFRGKHKFPVSIMMLFMNMDKAIGKDFEYGLNKLKNTLEK
jgi:hypothetical protein